MLASLWSVNDKSTSLFIQEFYRIRQQQRLTKGEALRKVQSAMIEGRIQGTGCGTRYSPPSGKLTAKYACDEKRPYSHPYYWAPFVLMGNFK